MKTTWSFKPDSRPTFADLKLLLQSQLEGFKCDDGIGQMGNTNGLQKRVADSLYDNVYEV